MASVDLAALDEETLADWLLEPPLVRLQGARRGLDRTSSTSSSLARRTRRALAVGAGRGALPGRHARPLPAAAGRRRPNGWTTRSSTTVGGVDGLRRVRRPARPASCSAACCATGAEVHGEHARVEFHWLDDVEPPRRRRRRAPDRRRAVQHVDRLRRALVLKVFRRVEAGRQPRARDAALPHRARLRAHRRARRAGTQYEGELMDATLGVVQRFVPDGRDGWELALDELADDPERFVDAPARARRGHRAHAHRRWPPTPPIRPSRPRSPSEESLALLTATIDEEIERVFLDLPDDTRRSRRSPAAARRCATACSCSRTSASAASSSATTATCTSARRCCGDGRLGRPRLRGRAGAAAARAPPQALAAARRRGHAALVRLRRLGQRAPARHARARGLGGARARGASWPATSRPSTPSLLPAGEAPHAHQLLSIFELEKAVYELRYELNNRPDWVRHPGGRHRPPARGAAADAIETDIERHRRERDLAEPHRAARRAPARTAAWSCAPSARRRPRSSRAPEGGEPVELEPAPPGRRCSRARSPGASCRCATSSRSTTRDGRHLHAARPVRVPADARRDRPAPGRRGPPRGALREARRARARDRRRRRAWRSRSGRRRRARSRVVGDFNSWDGRLHPMRSLGASGIWELFIPGVGRGRALQVRDPRARTASCC